jgi:GNAT superfamily N-acetyltransferase
MSSNARPPLVCTVLTARPADVDRAFYDLSHDMDPNFVHVFLDKLQRYAAKPDRALFLAEYNNRIIAFATIIDQAPAPDESSESTIRLLQTYACGTGLMVLPEFRRRGVAATLIQQWENWALENRLQGIWVVTRQMADWYQRCFSYSIHGVTMRHGVKKTVLIKTFPVKTF